MEHCATPPLIELFLDASHCLCAGVQRVKAETKKHIFGCKEKRNRESGRGVTELASDSCAWRRTTKPARGVELQQSPLVPPMWSTTLAGARSDQAEPSYRRNAFNSLYLGHKPAKESCLARKE